MIEHSSRPDMASVVTEVTKFSSLRQFLRGELHGFEDISEGVLSAFSLSHELPQPIVPLSITNWRQFPIIGSLDVGIRTDPKSFKN